MRRRGSDTNDDDRLYNAFGIESSRNLRDIGEIIEGADCRISLVVDQDGDIRSRGPCYTCVGEVLRRILTKSYISDHPQNGGDSSYTSGIRLQGC